MGFLRRLFGSFETKTNKPQLGGRGRKGGSVGIAHQFAFLDVETTGLDASKERVIEIAIVTTDGRGFVVDEWHSLVNPETGSAGPTRIHGIESEWLAAAPRFPELIGDISTRVRNRILVAHNSEFDMGFLEAEFRRAGHPIPDHGWQAMCTMDLAKQLGLPARLQRACHQLGVTYQAHHALADATACGEIFHKMMPSISRRTFGTDVSIPASTLPQVDPSGKAVHRKTAKDLTTARPVLADALDRLPPHDTSKDRDPEAASAYLTLAEEALADSYISPEEREQLIQMATRSGLSSEEVGELNHELVLGLIDSALDDRRISKTEKQEIQRAATWLDIDVSEWDAMVRAARKRVKLAQKTFSESLAGKTVSFSGRGIHPNNIREALAAKHAFHFTKSVSKKTDILVVGSADLETASVAKARDLGVPIFVESSFWARLGEL